MEPLRGDKIGETSVMSLSESATECLSLCPRLRDASPLGLSSAKRCLAVFGLSCRLLLDFSSVPHAWRRAASLDLGLGVCFLLSLLSEWVLEEVTEE